MLTALLMVASAASLSGDGTDAPYKARLFAQADVSSPAVNRVALEAERTRLLESRPSLGFPITMMSIGTGSTLIFSALLASWLGNGFGDGGAAVLGVLVAVSICTIALGVVSLIFRLKARSESEPRLQSLEKTLGPARPVPVEDNSPLPPPPPGPPPPPPGPDQGPPGPPPPPPPPLALLTF